MHNSYGSGQYKYFGHRTLIPISALTMPVLASTIRALVMTVSKATSLATIAACPMPSRSTYRIKGGREISDQVYVHLEKQSVHHLFDRKLCSRGPRKLFFHILIKILLTSDALKIVSNTVLKHY